MINPRFSGLGLAPPPDLNYDDFLALGEQTTSNSATRKKVAELLADAKFRDNWELAIWPGITTTKIDVWKVGGSEPAFTVIFAPGTPIEIYDSGRRCGTRVTVANAAERVRFIKPAVTARDGN